jgi:hypothetical protein
MNVNVMENNDVLNKNELSLTSIFSKVQTDILIDCSHQILKTCLPKHEYVCKIGYGDD